jgi:hypothetical protein
MAPDLKESSRVSTTEQSAVVRSSPIEPPPVAVRFASKGIHLTIIRVRRARAGRPDGNKPSSPSPIEYEFQEGFLTVYPGQDLLADKFNPATGEFEEQDALEFLQPHPLRPRGRLLGGAAIAPDPAPLLAESIMQLAVAAGNPAHARRGRGQARPDARARDRDVEAPARARRLQGRADRARVAARAARGTGERTSRGWAAGASRSRPAPPPPPTPETIASSAPRKPDGLNLTTGGKLRPRSGAGAGDLIGDVR